MIYIIDPAVSNCFSQQLLLWVASEHRKLASASSVVPIIQTSTVPSALLSVINGVQACDLVIALNTVEHCEAWKRVSRYLLLSP